MPDSSSSRLGPLVIPWATRDELAVIVVVGLLGALFGPVLIATALHHYRTARGRA